MIPDERESAGCHATERTLSYGWVIVAACTIMLFVHAGIQYTFGVFFKTLNAEFGSSRAAVSGVA